MSSQVISRITSMGRKVDPIIIRALDHSSPSKFRSALEYHFAAGGKRVRAALVLLSCAACGGKVEDALESAAVVELIHNYSLVMDDLIDHGEVRRGRPTVRVELGDSVALLVGMFYREIIDDLVDQCPNKEKVRKAAVEAMKEIIDGERLDLLFEQAGRDSEPYLLSNRVSDPDFRLYLDMIGKKTASLFRTAAVIGGLSARADRKTVENLGWFGWKSGLAFQVMDDVLDVYGESTGKEAAKDVIEHKLGNAAILVALRHLSPSRKRELLSILRSSKVTKAMATRAKGLAAATPAEYECKTVAMKYLEEAKKHLEALDGSKYKESLSQLADMFVLRSY